MVKHLVLKMIAESSALFCIDLIARGTPESVESKTLVKPETQSRESRHSGTKRKSAISKVQLRKMRVIFGAIQRGLTGVKYCAELDARKLSPSEQWKNEECPESYSLGYKDAKWRKRIQDEKCTFREKYDKTPAREREAIIQGELATRPTRQ